MSSSDSFWLHFWGTFATIGFVIVIIGVIIEGVEHFKKFPRKENVRKLQIEKLGWFLVVAGLAMEFLGDHAAKRISDREDARVNKEAANARVVAGNAEKEASKANERAALTESNNLVLQKELQPRMITREQKANFIFLTEEIPKFPVRVAVGAENAETFSYAVQIRAMLNQAGYGIPDSDTNYPEGIHTDPTAIFYFKVVGYSEQAPKQSSENPGVFFYTDNTNDLMNYNFMYGTLNVNERPRPIITGNEIENTNKTYGAIVFAFKQIGIPYWGGL